VAGAPVVRAPGGGGGSTDLPARYIPAGGAGTMGDAQLPVSLSSGVQAPQVGIAPQLSAPPAVGMSVEDEEQAALDAAIQLSLASSAPPAAAPAAAPPPVPPLGTDAMRPFRTGAPPAGEMDGLYEQLQLLLQQGGAGPVALKTLATVCGNVVKTPTESKFRSLKLTNPKIQERVVSVPGALGCLDAIGFRLDAKDGTQFATLPMDSPAEGVAQALELAINPALEVIAQQAAGGGAARKAGGTAIDRALAVYIPSESGPDPSRFDVPPEFFELSGSEAMAMVNTSQAKREADSVLRTKAMRENEQRGKKRNYRRCIVRVRFPDQTILQAVFLPRERLSKLYEVVTDALATPCAFSLFTHPLRTELADHSATLMESDLVPASLVNFRCLVRTSTETALRLHCTAVLMHDYSDYSVDRIIAAVDTNQLISGFALHATCFTVLLLYANRTCVLFLRRVGRSSECPAGIVGERRPPAECSPIESGVCRAKGMEPRGPAASGSRRWRQPFHGRRGPCAASSGSGTS
jgi:hypothetical protein